MTFLEPTVDNITLGDSVIVKNVGDIPLEWTWGGRRHVLIPMTETQVSFDLMKKECGDPRSGEHQGKLKDEFNGLMVLPSRSDEVNRLMSLHAPTLRPGDPPFPSYVPGDRTKFKPGEPITNNAPRVEVYTLDGQRVYTVLDDPYGDRIVAANPTRSDVEFTQSTMRQMAETMAEQRKMIEALTRKLNMDVTDLGPDLPLGRQEASVGVEGGLDGVAEEEPRMMMNPRTNKVSRARKAVADPKGLDDLPEDD